MHRVVLTLGGTVAGLALLLSFKSHSAAPAAAPAGAPAAGGTPGARPGGSSSPAAAMSARATGSPAATSAAAATRVVTGSVDDTQYGPMQVQLTLAGQKITKVTVLQRTDSGTESNEIDSFAIPRLTSETLAAQNGRIDAVSGATYTSAGYVASLQSALDKAGA
jgi:uncharacterized protein with FMN-binding domain